MTNAEELIRSKRTNGFREALPGKIHIRCWNCGRKMSNVPRSDYDPPRAFLAETPCPACCDKLHALDPGVDYYDTDGFAIPDEEVQRAYEQGS